MKVLALDNLQKVGIDVFTKEGIEVDVKGKMTPEELAAAINQYDAVVVRGATKATAPCFENSSRAESRPALSIVRLWSAARLSVTSIGMP